jgi:predicted DNA-binding protein YlxM (UPF0122 family)
MAIRLERLNKQAAQVYQMQLLAGEGGLGNIVNWVHMIEDDQVAEFLRGNELVFTTGIGHPGEVWLNGFVHRLAHNNASGLVVNIGPYINSVPEDVIEYCNRSDFPLFTIPWHIRLVDVTRDFCRRIIKSEQNEIGVSSAFKNAIFFPGDIARYQAQLERHGFSVASRYCAAVIAINSEDDDKHKANIAAVRFYAENIINRISDRYSLFLQENRLTVVFSKWPDKEIAACMDKIVKHYQANGRGYQIHIGIGQNEEGLSTLAKSYKQAASGLHMAVKSNSPAVYYNQLGIYKILLGAEDDEVLRGIYDDILGKLADYDATHHTDYMSTLKCYLENDASVQAVAKLTFVHRNTINYKINKIKEITGCDIAGVEDRLKIMLAFKIKDIL